jgi:hypothetical protein
MRTVEYIQVYSQSYTQPSLERNPFFVGQKLQFDSEVRRKRREEAEEVARSEDAAVLRDDFHLLLKDGASCVSGEDQESTDWTFTGM